MTENIKKKSSFRLGANTKEVISFIHCIKRIPKKILTENNFFIPYDTFFL
jgi:hypothetical protein